MIEKNELEQERQLKSLVLVSLGSFLMFFYVFLAGADALLRHESKSPPNPEIYGSSVVAENGIGEGFILLNNSTLGRGVLEFHLPSSVDLAGAELRAVIVGDLQIDDILCHEGFYCADLIIDDILYLNILRLPEFQGEPISGKYEIATIFYDGTTAGELHLNIDQVDQSSVLLFNGGDNILPFQPIYLSVGHSSYSQDIQE